MGTSIEQARDDALAKLSELEKSFSSISLGQMTVQEFGKSVAGLLKLNRAMFEVAYNADDRIRQLAQRIDALERRLRDG